MRALDDNLSVVELDINSLKFEHILHAGRVAIIGNDFINVGSRCARFPIFQHNLLEQFKLFTGIK